jgi:hypothetical protein
MNALPLRALPLLLAATFFLACSEDGDSPSDASSGQVDGSAGADASGAAIDGGGILDAGLLEDAGAADVGSKPDGGGLVADGGEISACSDLAAEACLSNRDCTSHSDVCRSFSDSLELRCCVAGSRGTGPAGAPCAADEECAFGRCLARDDGARFCSGDCTADPDDCPSSMTCSALFKWCVPLDAGVPPADCDQVSLSQCFFNDNCQANERCENLGTLQDEVLCCTVGARGQKAVGSACSSELECDFGRCLRGLCSAECDEGVDPCPPATMECNLLRGLCEPSP